MRNFLKDFTAFLVAAAAVLGFYVGAVAINAVPLFWACVAVAILVGIRKVAGARFIDIFRRQRDYPALLQKSGELEASCAELSAKLASAEKHAVKQLEIGMQEGKSRVFGAVYAQTVKPFPKVWAVSSSGSQVKIIGECQPGSVPLVGSRYSLVLARTRETRGIVEVYERVENPPQVTLFCVQSDMPAFWRRLSDEAQYNSTPSVALELEPTTFDTPGQLPIQIESSESPEVTDV